LAAAAALAASLGAAVLAAALAAALLAAAHLVIALHVLPFSLHIDPPSRALGIPETISCETGRLGGPLLQVDVCT
jgi:hypothetical protein